MNKHKIDWSAFDNEPEKICYCYCGQVFRTHAKLIEAKDGVQHITREKCPGCGKEDNSRIIRSEINDISLTGRKLNNEKEST